MNNMFLRISTLLISSLVLTLLLTASNFKYPLHTIANNEYMNIPADLLVGEEDLNEYEIENLFKPNTNKQHKVQTQKRTLPVLCYHGVADKAFGLEGLFVTVNEFETQMKFLKDNNFTVIGIDELQNYENYIRPVLITFDDGYEDNYTSAYPILKKYNFKATIFLMTAAIDSGLYLKKNQIIEMRDLISFQSHTVNHPHLAEISKENMEQELSESKKIIEDLTGNRVFAIAYPFGNFDKKVMDISKKYYNYSFALNDTSHKTGDDLQKINRLYIPRNMDMKIFEKFTGLKK